MKNVDCSKVTGDCPTNFRISSENEEELVRMVRDHARTQHNMDMDRDQARSLLR